MTKKIERTFRNFNRLLDDDYQKLYDKYKNLKLSHNRKVKLLMRVFYFDSDEHAIYEDYEKLISDIYHELNNPYRCFDKVFYINKEKGGKHA